MSRHQTAAATSPASDTSGPGFSLPARYTPRVAGYASGPFITPVTVTPSEWRWRNARAVTVTDKNGHDWRCIRVCADGVFVGYWAVDLLGLKLDSGEWDV